MTTRRQRKGVMRSEEEIASVNVSTKSEKCQVTMMKR